LGPALWGSGNGVVRGIGGPQREEKGCDSEKVLCHGRKFQWGVEGRFRVTHRKPEHETLGNTQKPEYRTLKRGRIKTKGMNHCIHRKIRKRSILLK